ncbi:MAG: glycosyltransferase family 2 protein, partial [Acidimicrobiia bacterium]
MPQELTISVVIPVHNEAGYLAGAVEELYAQLAEVPASVSVLLAENGSTDATASLAEELAGSYEGLSVLRLPDPDYGEAMRNGFLATTGDWVVNFDIDYFSGAFLQQVLDAGDGKQVALEALRK